MPKYRFTEIAINSTEKKKPTEADKETYIGLEHLDSGTLTVSRWGSEVAPIGEKLLMKKGDVLFGKRRAYQKKVGIAPFDGIFSAHGMVLRPREEVITKEYFPLFISSDYFLNEAIRISVGSLSPTVNWKDLKDLTFNIPTIEEQRRITPLVWAAIKAKNAYKTLIQRTDDLVKSQFIEMFGNEENIVPLSDCGRIITGGTPPKKHEEYYSSRDIHFYKPNDCHDQCVTLLDASEEYISEAARKVADVFPAGTVLVTCIGTIGKIGILKGEGTCNQQINAILPHNEKCMSEYIAGAIWVKRDDLIQLANATTVTIINKTSFSSFKIPLPKMEQQRQFVEFVQQSDKSKFVVSNRNLSRCLEPLKVLRQAWITRGLAILRHT